MYLLSFAIFIAVSSAAQLPSNSYLPQNQGPAIPPSNTYIPSNSYLPQNQGPAIPSNNYIPQNQGPSAITPSKTYIPQNQGPNTISPSNTYIPQAQGPGTFQGGYQGSFGNNYQGNFGGAGGSGSAENRRPQQEQEKNSAVVKQDQEINENGFHYSYETSNGIRAEEAGNEIQTQGGFSYKGDDGNIYTVVYTAGEGGFRPQGDHLPVPPPTPEAILLALEQNAKDEAAGIFDDGQYRPKDHGRNNGNGGSGYLSGSSFGSSNHQGSFNTNSGYRY